MYFCFDTLYELESIDNSTVAMEVCSPWSLYSAIVTSTVYIGTPVLVVRSDRVEPFILVGQW